MADCGFWWEEQVLERWGARLWCEMLQNSARILTVHSGSEWNPMSLTERYSLQCCVTRVYRSFWPFMMEDTWGKTVPKEFWFRFTTLLMPSKCHINNQKTHVASEGVGDIFVLESLHHCKEIWVSVWITVSSFEKSAEFPFYTKQYQSCPVIHIQETGIRLCAVDFFARFTEFLHHTFTEFPFWVLVLLRGSTSCSWEAPSLNLAFFLSGSSSCSLNIYIFVLDYFCDSSSCSKWVLSFESWLFWVVLSQTLGELLSESFFLCCSLGIFFVLVLVPL